MLYAAIGLILGAFISIIALVGGGAGNNIAAGLVSGIGAIIMLPLLYGAAGFIGGAIGALLYNIAAGFVGGIKVDLE